MKIKIISIVSILMLITLSNTALAQQASTTEVKCPCEFNADNLVKQISTVKKGMVSCTVVNANGIDSDKKNAAIASGITIIVAGESSTANEAKNTPITVQWSLGYSNASSNNNTPENYCTTDVLNPSALKSINYNEYLVCLRSILLAAKAANVECIPIIKFPEPVTQPVDQQSAAQQPAMMDHVKIKEYFAQITPAAAPYKAAVQTCIEKTGTPKGCNAGTNGIPAAVTIPIGQIQEITVEDGVIKIAPVPKDGIKVTDNYVVYPEYKDGIVKWQTSGGAVTQGYAD